MSSNLLHQTHSKSVNIGDRRDFLDVFGARLTPPFLQFQQAFEGRTYKQKLSIQNIGKSKIVVRITEPTSYAFKIKPVKGYNLSPGLTLAREVSCTFSYANSRSCIIAIYINGNRYDYQLSATVSYSEVDVTPKSIDFGSIDVGYASPARNLFLKNEGSKPTRFYIDTAIQNDYTLIIEPPKGMLQANSSTSVSIKLIPEKEGVIQMNLWVKAEKPNVIMLKAEAISSRFEPIGSSLLTTFTLVDFPATYLGITSTQTIYIRNFSASANMFCMMGEADGTVSTLDVCRERHVDYNHFSAVPSFGMFQPRQVKAINFKFQPKKLTPDYKPARYYFCTLHMCKIRSKFLTPDDYSELLKTDVLPISFLQTKFSWNSSFIGLQASDIDHSILLNKDEIGRRELSFVKPAEQCNCVKLYLHAIPETPKVAVVPDQLIVTDMVMGERATRVVELRNCSEYLPIIVVYKKIAFIDLESTDIFIKANTSVQIAVYITPKMIGAVNTHLNFDLVYYDFPRRENDERKVIGKLLMPVSFAVKSVPKLPKPQVNSGLGPNYLNEVGKSCDDLRFNSRNVKIPKTTMVSNEFVDKSSSALIALPNDMQRSLRPWRNKPKCKTIFTKLVRYEPPINSEYELTVFEKRMKVEQDNYYENYIRQEAKRLKLAALVSKKAAGDYEVDNSNKLLCTDLRLPLPEPVKANERRNYSQYLPLLLDPLQIINIVVDPLIVHTGPIAAHAKYEFTVNVKNNNDIAISVRIRPDKSNVFFPEGNQRMVNGHKEVAFPILYVSTTVGFHTAELKLVINECAYIIVDVMANVCPVALKLDKSEVEFDSDIQNQYVKIINPLSTPVDFEWRFACNNFRIEPREGYCKGRNSLLCLVEYLPNVDGPSITDVDFSCVDKTIDQLRLVVQPADRDLYFDEPHLILKDIPLNIPRMGTVLLKNDSSILQCYSLIEDEFAEFIQVDPSRGTVHPRSFNTLTLTVKLTACVHFTATLRFHIIRSKNIELKVSGNVVYPNVVIWPGVLHFRKIPSSTTDAVRLNIENKSQAEAVIAFEMSMYSDYAITKSSKFFYADVVERIAIERFASIHLYAHFKPTAPSTDKFVLPMIINDILGPVVSNETKNVRHFLKAKIPTSTPLALPHHLPISTVHSYATESKIVISRTHIKLIYAYSPKDRRTSCRLKIANPQGEAEKFCIRTDDLEQPLYLTHLEGKRIEQLGKAIVCDLDPLEEVFFEVSFEPDYFGFYQASLPIFLRSDKSTQPHNYLYIEAIYEAPTITMDSSQIYCRPLPPKLAIVTTRRFIFTHHWENCKVSCESNVPTIEIRECDRHVIDDALRTQEVWFRAHIQLQEFRGSFRLSLTVRCTCGEACNVDFHVIIENCFLTNYPLVYCLVMNTKYNLRKEPSVDLSERRSLVSLFEPQTKVVEEYDMWSFYETYPLFPTKSRVVNELAAMFLDFMETSVTIMEWWISSQGFFGLEYYKIPDGISYVKFYEDENDEFKVKLPVVDMLINVIGENVEKYFEVTVNTKFDSAEQKQVYIVYQIYKKVLDFLTSLGAYFACVHPAYLLPFKMYSLFVDQVAKTLKEEKILIIKDHLDFYRLSKQCWLDVFLQTYKVTVLKRVINPVDDRGSRVEEPHHPRQKYRHSIKNIVRNNHLFSTPELLLLNWLEFHYNDERSVHWPDNPYLEYRQVSHFGENLEDGYVFACVTLAYCPYLADHFKKMAPQPVSMEEILHNNILLVQSWEILNLNTGITVRNLVEAHPLKTLLTIVYLFETLPTLHPVEQLEFKAGLSEHVTQTLTLRNKNDFEVAYKAIVYGDEKKCFAIKKHFYVIAPKSKCKIQVTYWAKFVKCCSCTLILSGECSGYRLAKSKVVTLSGQPDISSVAAVYDISVELYKIHDEKLIIQSPYAVAASYRIQQTYRNCLTPEEVEQLPYRESFPSFSLPRCISTVMELMCNENGEAELPVCLYPLTLRTIPTMMYFRNQEVGDFAIKITTVATPLQRQEILKVELPCGFGSTRTKDSEIFLEIPCQHHIMWKGIIDMLLKFAVTDVLFWKDVIHTTAGMHALQRLLCLAIKPYSDDLNLSEACHFKIKPERRSGVILPDTVYIEDRCLSGYVRVPITFKRKNEARNFSVALKSLDGLEIRQYAVCFIPKEGSDHLQDISYV
ncbi:hypothetical protein Trydic_g7809 [Trypoxylus dichotomus]